MNNGFFYEEINRAGTDVPHVQTLRSLQYRAHYHEEVEIMLVREGVIVLTVEGQDLELHAGDIALVRPFLIHSLRTPEYSLIYLFKILCPLFDFSSVYRDRDDPVLHPASEEHAAAFGFMQRIVEESSLPDSDPLKRMALRAVTDSLLVHMARLPDVRPVEKEAMLALSRDVELLKTLNDYLADHYQDNISLETAAAVCHMSMYYFAHSFKRTTGTTFLSYLNGYRLEQAKRRIVETEDSFTTIAMQCGFPSIRTFNRCFQKHFKLTPTEARARWKSNT